MAFVALGDEDQAAAALERAGWRLGDLDRVEINEAYAAVPLAVMKECPESCGLCTTVCQDHDESCKGWAKDGQCEDNKPFMYRVCPASCGICSDIDKDEL